MVVLLASNNSPPLLGTLEMTWAPLGLAILIVALTAIHRIEHGSGMSGGIIVEGGERLYPL